jgi:hypothetical protein
MSPSDAENLYNSYSSLPIINAAMGIPPIDVSDSASITESISAVKFGHEPVFASDAVLLSEYAAGLMSDLVAETSDTASIAESIIMGLSIRPSAYDAISIAENIANTMSIEASAFDTLTLAESILFNADILPNVYDEVTVSEYAAAARSRLIELYESVSVDEWVLVLTVVAQGLVTISARQKQATMTADQLAAGVSAKQLMAEISAST